MNIDIIEIDGKEYELCLNRKAIKIAENAGLTPDAFEKRPLSAIDALWRASFIIKHPEVTEEKASELYDLAEAKDSELLGNIIKKLVDKYVSFFKALSNIQ